MNHIKKYQLIFLCILFLLNLKFGSAQTGGAFEIK